MLSPTRGVRITELPPDTVDYLRKLPGRARYSVAFVVERKDASYTL